MSKEPEQVSYNAFAEDTDDKELPTNKGLKLSNKNSRFSKSENASKAPSQQEFERDVQELKARTLEIRNKVESLTNKYKEILKDRVLPANKSAIQKDLELSLVKELVQLGLQLDNDDSQPEGIGSIGLCNLLLLINLHQRDAINQLGYELSKIRKVLANVDKKPE
jgi:hypothetical protein